MRLRRAAGALTAGVVGLVAGAVLTLALQGTAVVPGRTARLDPGEDLLIRSEALAPDTFLTWTPGGLPSGFRDAVIALPGIERAVVVASDTLWLTRSWSKQGEVVDDPRNGYAIPMEVAAVDPGEYGPFLPPADREIALALQAGLGALGESGARLRGLGPGAVLTFGSERVEVAAILPDELVGAHELLVSRDTGRRLGVFRDRYALLVPSDEPTERQLAKRIRGVLPPGVPLRVRAPGQTPYFRQGDAVLPPVQLKLLFGEFTARPWPGRPGYLLIDPAWERTHIATERIPLLGPVTCHVALFPQIRGAIAELIDLGLRDTISSFSGCYARRFANRDPSQAISHHTWGVALDINVPQNPFGAPPNQDPEMVEVFERWGFIWGGDFILPDGMHFEYRRPPA